MTVIEDEEDLNQNDLAYAVAVMAGYRSRTNIYLSMKNKEAHTAYLLRMITKEKRKDGGHGDTHRSTVANHVLSGACALFKTRYEGIKQLQGCLTPLVAVMWSYQLPLTHVAMCCMSEVAPPHDVDDFGCPSFQPLISNAPRFLRK